jgi:hypothetical protein
MTTRARAGLREVVGGVPVVNRRKRSTVLSCDDIKELEAAKGHAKALNLELNTHLIFAPYLDDDVYLDDVPIPSPVDIAATFDRLLKHLSVWTRRHTRRRFTYLRVVHSAEDSSGHNPHLHVFMHLPNAKFRDKLQAALIEVYGYTLGGGSVAKVVAGTDRKTRHESRYWGSTFDYTTRHKTQQVYYAQGGNVWRASRRDAEGRHRGVRCPFVGRRWNVSRNLLPAVYREREFRLQRADAKRAATIMQHVAAERALAASGWRPN